ncbi:hypothetical protein BLNAU_4040 [Blattamonas nauphoetae]|uniref:Uncharacterized protein n=1 Tax=Blattamonas nauphoetae TaxID=2049346 RepID=A0ABQ9YB96_9EUKA|nr:hypothetical protein BLNAU_4040 [Blattamonas nauphoetae]
MKISLDPHPTSTLPSNSIDHVPVYRMTHRSVSGFEGWWRDRPITPEFQQNHPGLGKRDKSNPIVDRIIVDSDYTAIHKNSIDIAPCAVVVEDGIVNMGGLDGDELGPFWTSWKVSELALNFSDTKSEVEQASGRI